MNYLKEYGMDEKQINDIIKTLKEKKLNIDLFMFEPDKIRTILDMFKNLGIYNFYDILTISPQIFFDTIDSVKIRLYNYDDLEELSRLINEDVYNLSLVDLL